MTGSDVDNTFTVDNLYSGGAKRSLSKGTSNAVRREFVT